MANRSCNGESVSALLAGFKRGDCAAEARLMELIYGDLRRIAARYLIGERRNHTLQPTALVNEAYLKLIAQDLSWENRAHFLATAATVMRNILVDSARAHRAAKRGGGRQIVTLAEDVAFAGTHPVDVLVLEELLDEMRTFDPRSVRLIEMRFYGGLSIEEAAQVLGVGSRTAKRDFEAARRWLRSRLEAPPDVQPHRSPQ
jgi:RNA polymerase sigma-70 factor (ECF subfamily)